jgi:hypothetical protein
MATTNIGNHQKGAAFGSLFGCILMIKARSSVLLSADI